MVGRPKSGDCPSVVADRGEITAQMLRSILHYDPETGVFTWIVNRGYNRTVGRIAGGCNRGRWRIKVFGRLCEASNLAWLYMTGGWPSADVDHEDRKPLNNRWDNLRDASRSQNCMNQEKRRTNTSGYKGVTAHKGGWWWARISAAGVRYHLGLYREPEQAAAAYRIAAAGIHGEFSGV